MLKKSCLRFRSYFFVFRMSLIPTMNTVLTGLVGFSVKPIFPVEQYITPERILCAKKTGLKVLGFLSLEIIVIIVA